VAVEAAVTVVETLTQVVVAVELTTVGFVQILYVQLVQVEQLMVELVAIPFTED
jgi:hypothetical protein